MDIRYAVNIKLGTLFDFSHGFANATKITIILVTFRRTGTILHKVFIFFSYSHTVRVFFI